MLLHTTIKILYIIILLVHFTTFLYIYISSSHVPNVSVYYITIFSPSSLQVVELVQYCEDSVFSQSVHLCSSLIQDCE